MKVHTNGIEISHKVNDDLSRKLTHEERLSRKLTHRELYRLNSSIEIEDEKSPMRVV